MKSMPILRAGITMITLVFGAACTHDDSEGDRVLRDAMPDSEPDTGTSNPRDGGPSEPDAGTPVSCDDLQPPATDVDGLLTAYPGVSVSIQHPALAARSVSFSRNRFDSSKIATIQVEVENTGDKLLCMLQGTVVFNDEPFIGTLHGPAYYWTEDAREAWPCLATDDVGVIVAVNTRESIDVTALASGRLEVHVDADVDFFDDSATPAVPSPTLARYEFLAGSDGLEIRGEVDIPESVHGYQVTMFGRDSRGLLMPELTGTINEYGTVDPGRATTEIDPDHGTNSLDCEFEDGLTFHEWKRDAT